MSQLQRQASTPSVAASSASSSSSQTAANGNPKKLQIVPAPFPERRDFLAPYTQRVGILTKHQPGMFKKDPWKARFIVVTQMASPKEPNKIFDSIHSFKTNEPLKWEQERLRLTTESTVTVTDELAGDANIYVLKLTGMVPLNRGNASPGFLMPPEQQGKFYFAMDNAQELSTWLSYFKSIVQDAQQREWKLPPPQQVRRPQSRNQQPSLAISRSGEPFSPTGSSFSDRSQTREEDLPYHLDTTLYIAPPPLPRSSYPSSETSSLSSYANNSSSSERRISTAPSWSTAPSSAYNMNSPPPIIEVPEERVHKQPQLRDMPLRIEDEDPDSDLDAPGQRSWMAM